jgi:hypothetical protein
VPRAGWWAPVALKIRTRSLDLHVLLLNLRSNTEVVGKGLQRLDELVLLVDHDRDVEVFGDQFVPPPPDDLQPRAGNRFLERLTEPA